MKGILIIFLGAALYGQVESVERAKGLTRRRPAAAGKTVPAPTISGSNIGTSTTQAANAATGATGACGTATNISPCARAAAEFQQAPLGFPLLYNNGGLPLPAPGLTTPDGNAITSTSIVTGMTFAIPTFSVGNPAPGPVVSQNFLSIPLAGINGPTGVAFTGQIKSSPFLGDLTRNDPTLDLGFNPTCAFTSEPGEGLHLESYYSPTSGLSYMEGGFTSCGTPGVSNGARPFYYQITRTSSKVNTFLIGDQIEIGNPNGIGIGSPAFILYPGNQTQVYDPLDQYTNNKPWLYQASTANHLIPLMFLDSRNNVAVGGNEAGLNAAGVLMIPPLTLGNLSTGIAHVGSTGLVTSSAVNLASGDVTGTLPGVNGGMIYPGAGVATSTGAAWGPSYAVGTAANNLLQLNAAGQLPAISAANLTNFPTLNQSTTGNAATATALAGTPTLCQAGQVPAGILANGNATGCAAPSVSNSMPVGGDLSGALPAPVVVQVNGGPIPTAAALTSTNSSNQFQPATAAAVAAVKYAAGGGTANAQTAAYSPAIPSLTTGLDVCWLPIAANTAATPTFAPSGLAAQTLVKTGGAALVANDLTPAAIACAIYDGTNWELHTPQSLSGNAATATALASTPSQCAAAQYATGIAANGNANCAMLAAKLITYPAAGVANSTGSAWGPSYAVGTGANNLVQLNAGGQLPAVSAANLTNFPTLNQSTTGTAATALTLAATPSQCTGLQFAKGVAANGNAVCSTPPGFTWGPGTHVYTFLDAGWSLNSRFAASRAYGSKVLYLIAVPANVNGQINNVDAYVLTGPGKATAGEAVGIYSGPASGATLVASSTLTNTNGKPQSWTLPSAATITAGTLYWLGWCTDDSAIQLEALPATQIDLAMLNIGSDVRTGMAANACSGSGSTLAPPSSTGIITAVDTLGQMPFLQGRP